MYRPRAATYLGAMQTERRAALEALHERIRRCLVDVEPKVLTRRSSPIAELVGRLLMDLDLLSSHSPKDQACLPEFATEFMNKRLARRLAERYKDRDLVAEIDRRFAIAQSVAGEDRAELEPVMGRIRSRLKELEAALSSTDAGR